MRPHVAFVAAGLVGIAQAGADVVVFDNSDGTFVWDLSYTHTFPRIPGTFLRIDQPPTQSGAAHPNGLAKANFLGKLTPHESWDSFEQWQTGDTVLVIEDTEPTVVYREMFGAWDVYFASTLNGGDVVGPDSNLDVSAPWRLWTTYPDDAYISFPTHIGVSIELVDGTHYGWIRIEGDPLDPHSVRPVAWAYETLPNTPITIVPAPGAGVLAAAALVGFGARRRRPTVS